MCVYIRLYTCVYVYSCTYTCIYMYMYIYRDRHTYTHTHICIHISNTCKHTSAGGSSGGMHVRDYTRRDTRRYIETPRQSPPPPAPYPLLEDGEFPQDDMRDSVIKVGRVEEDSQSVANERDIAMSACTARAPAGLVYFHLVHICIQGSCAIPRTFSHLLFQE